MWPIYIIELMKGIYLMAIFAVISSVMFGQTVIDGYSYSNPDMQTVQAYAESHDLSKMKDGDTITLKQIYIVSIFKTPMKGKASSGDIKYVKDWMYMVRHEYRYFDSEEESSPDFIIYYKSQDKAKNDWYIPYTQKQLTAILETQHSYLRDSETFTFYRPVKFKISVSEYEGYHVVKFISQEKHNYYIEKLK